MPVLLALLALLPALPPAPAAAHANLVRSNPAAGAVLPVAPPSVQLWFSEEPDLHFSEVHVLDTRRQQHDAGDLHAAPGDPLALIIGLQPLSDGLYTVVWKTVSSVDGHTVSGSFPFTVGAPIAGAPVAAMQSTPGSGATVDTGAVIDRWLSLLSAIVLMGAFAMPLLVLLPAWRAATAARGGPGAMATPEVLRRSRAPLEPDLLRRARGVAQAAWALLALSAVFALLVHTHSVAGGGPGDLFGGPLRTVLFHTRYGRTWWLRCVASAVAGVVLLLQGRVRDGRAHELLLGATGVVAVEAVFLAYSLNSHAAALRTSTTLATASDLLHLTATGLWIGGLVQLALVVAAALRTLAPAVRARFLAAMTVRFSTLATVCVTLLVVTGVYQSLRQLSAWELLWQSGYGRTLLVKLALVLPLLLLGALNLLVVRPALTRAAGLPDSGPVLRVRRWSHHAAQRSFMAAVAAEMALGLAVVLVVGLLVNQPPARAAQAAPTAGIALHAKTGNDEVRLLITPGGAGQNHFEAVVREHGKPPRVATALVLRVTFQDADTGTSEIPTTAVGDGRFSADADDLSTYGRWQVLALIQPPAADEVRVSFDLALNEGSASGSGSNQAGDVSVQRGRQLYTANCARCHGATGHGDGPDGKKLDPPPADLWLHTATHPDQQLLDWIANGIPTSGMPAFGDKLNAEQRQAILNYLRSLTGGATPVPSPTTAR